MRRVKKALIVIAAFSLVLIVSIYFQYGAISPVSDITGCYETVTDSFTDKVCLNKTGKYQQFFMASGEQRSEEKYNEATWNSFLYSNDEGEFIAGTLKGFLKRGADGEIIDVRELDIQPHKNTFGKVVFEISGLDVGETRIYFRTSKDKAKPSSH